MGHNIAILGIAKCAMKVEFKKADGNETWF